MKLLFAAALLLASSATQMDAFAAELKVLSGNGAKAAVRELCSQFERATGNKISLRFEVNADLKSKIEAGESFDVAVLNPPPMPLKPPSKAMTRMMRMMVPSDTGSSP